jgi:hypothetical protein
MADYATLLRDRVTLQYRAIDRIFLQAYVPKLQSVGQVCTFLRWQRKFKIPSSAAFGQIGDAYVKAVHRFAQEHQIPLVHFKKGEDKEEITRPYLDAAARDGKERVVLIGIGQEKASAWRSWPRKGQEQRPHPHMDWGRQMVFINHFYFYLWDSEWGGTFWNLRRLIRKQLIVKIPHTRRYQLTVVGRRVAVLFTKTYGRVLAPGLGILDPRLPDVVTRRSPLAVAWHRFESALDQFIGRNLIAA